MEHYLKTLESLAGQKLIRIRSKLDINLVRNDFKKLIKELIK